MMTDAVHLYPMSERLNLVHRRDFARLPASGWSIKPLLDALPGIHAGKKFRQAIDALATAARNKHFVLLGMGAHVIKCGLTPYLVRLMEAGVIKHIALNGAGAIHDFELAYAGETSEDVAVELPKGRFGFVDETGRWMAEALVRGTERDLGMGVALGRFIDGDPGRFAHRDASLLWHAYRLDVPVSVHVAIGTDIVHLHPATDGAILGKATLADFNLFCAGVTRLAAGVYWNLGSAVILPEVFLKAVSRAHNTGHHLEGMTTLNMDMLMQYRTAENVVRRPSLGVGLGLHLTGHHEIMVPLLALAVLEDLAASAPGAQA